jgi:hypothetical protein
MKRPPEYYTLWNQAVEAVEIYLARNPRELTVKQLLVLFTFTCNYFTNATKNHKVTIDPTGDAEQALVHDLIQTEIT